MKKQKRGIVPESQWTERLIAVGIVLVLVLVVMAFAGCTTVQREAIKNACGQFKATPSPEAPEAPVKTPTPAPVAHDLPAGITWLNVDASGWPVTARLHVSVNGNSLTMDSDKKDVWPDMRMKASDGSTMNATAVALIQHGGKWYATAFEFMKHGQSVKSVSGSFRGGNDHMKAPLNTFVPRSGERYGFIITTPSRSETTINERSKVVWVEWP